MSLARHSYLYIAFSMVVLIVAQTHLLHRVLLVAAWIGYCYIYDRGKLICVVLFVTIIGLANLKVETASNKIVKIDEIHNSYVIASSGKEKSILYNVEEVNLQDIIEVRGEFERIHSSNNLYMFDFAEYCERKGIVSSMYVTSFETISKSANWKARLYRKVQSIDDKEVKSVLNQMLYRIDDKEEKMPLIYASGMHLSFCIAFFSKLLKCSYQKVSLVISLFYFVLFPVHFFVVRIFFTALVNLMFASYHVRERIGISIIIMLFYNVNCIFEISFIIPILFRVASAFNIARIPKIFLQMLLVLPVQLYFFHECNVIELFCFTLLKNIGGMTFLLGCVSLCCPFLYGVLMLLYEFQIELYSLLDTTYSFVGKPWFVWMLIWYGVIIMLLNTPKKQHAAVILFLLVWQFHLKIWNPIGEVTFMDVGQGDCILIREALNGEVLLIDAAGKMNQDLAKDIIYPCLRMKGIKKIDKLVITHDDYDHSGGLKSLKKLMPIQEVITKPRDIEMSKTTLYSLNELQENADKNDNSIVLFAKVNHLTYLFMGDAPKAREKEILKVYNRLHCDILKVGHHGSNTSSDEDFITQIHPLVSVISSGYKNRYNHPDQEVVAILKKACSFIANTQTSGSISIYNFFNWNF